MVKGLRVREKVHRIEGVVFLSPNHKQEPKPIRKFPLISFIVSLIGCRED